VPRASLWQRLVHRWPAKLLSLLAAFLLWYQLKQTGPVVERAIERPLEVIGLGPNQVAVGVPDRVLIRVRGEERTVEGLRPEAVLAYLDLHGIQEGPFRKPVVVQLPAGVALAAVIPERVEARVERSDEKTLPLYAFLPGRAVLPQARSVRVRGAASRVARARYALALGEGGALRVVAVDEAGWPLDLKARPETTGTRFAGPLLSRKELPLALPGPPPGLSVRRARIPRSIPVVGPPEALAGLAFVTGSVEWRVGSYVAPIRLRLPEGVYALKEPWGRFVVERVQ